MQILSCRQSWPNRPSRFANWYCHSHPRCPTSAHCIFTGFDQIWRVRTLADGWRSDQPYACVTCEAGKFRAETMQISECVVCPIGTFATAGASECLQCELGRVTNTRGIGSTGCITCPPGQEPNAQRRWCVPCGRSMYSQFGFQCIECPSPSIVNNERTACAPPYNCPAGSACPRGVDCVQDSDCERCPPGSVSLGVESCILCTEQGKVNNTEQSVCETCRAGTEPNAERSACLPCSGNLYSTFGIQCVDCLSPSSVNPARTACSAPFVCPPGSQCPGITDCTDVNECQACEPGWVSIGTQLCTPCTELGKVNNTDQSSCQSCSSGTEPNEQRSHCLPCTGTLFSTFGIRCQSCPGGRAPSADHTTCIGCEAGTAGSAGACFPCEDGTEPDESSVSCIECPVGRAGASGTCTHCMAGRQQSSDRTECVQCPSTSAGTDGQCNQCQAGHQPNAQYTACIACPTGSAGVGGFCDTCESGAQPNTEHTACIACAEGEAGTSGTCSVCSPGREPAAARDSCVPCGLGTAGAAGVCELCAPGRSPSHDQVSCDVCAQGSAGSNGTCVQCRDGKQSNDPLEPTVCVSCPAGFAGTGGTCAQCIAGQQPNNASTACEMCSTGRYSADGTSCEACVDVVDDNGVAYGMCTSDLVHCDPCADGTEPTDDHSGCQPCPISTAGLRGVCELCVDEVIEGVTYGKFSSNRISCDVCADGSEPNAVHTECLDCPAGTAGQNGVCERCSVGQQPSSDRSECLNCN
eukprot:SAG31_NODE_2111_length_6426_cov_4.423295_8_plen_750_part_01